MKSSASRACPVFVSILTLAFSPTLFAGANAANYNLTVGGGIIVPGTTDTGNHTDDGETAVALPFAVTFYDQSFAASSNINVSSNGFLQFSGSSDDHGFCIPDGVLNNAIAGFGNDQRTDRTGGGIFTSISGTAPHRIFNIEWRTVDFTDNSKAKNYEIRLFEGRHHIEVIYGTMTGGSVGGGGVQRTDASGGFATSFSCNLLPASGARAIYTEITITGSLIQSSPGSNFNGAVATFTTTRTDAPVSTDFAANIDWGDGTAPSLGAVSGGPGTGPYTVSGTHTYQTAGQFVTTITVTDTTNSHTDLGNGAAGTSCATPPDNMVSWWRAEGDVKDAQDGNDGTFNGTPAYASGEVGQAFSFDGDTANYIFVPHNTNLDLAEFTVDAWVYPTGGVDGTVIDKEGSNGINYSLFVGANGSVEVDFNPGNHQYADAPPGSAPQNTWTHITGTYDGPTSKTLKLYINGVLAAVHVVGDRAGDAGQETPPTGQDLVIGVRGGNTLQGPFDGLIDEVEVFSRALTDSEVFSIYAAGSYGKCTPTSCATPPPGLTNWYPAEGSADDVIGGKNGTNQGATFAAGKVNQAFSFTRLSDGTGTYVALPDNFIAYPTLSGMSFDAWFKTPPITNVNGADVTGGGGVILGQDSGTVFDGVSGFVPAVYVGTDGKLYAEMFYTGGNNHVISAARVDDDNWHHVAVSYNCSTPGNSSTCSTTVYLDGASIGNVASAQSAFGSGTYLYQIGTGDTSGWDAGNGTWFTFSGSIDEVEFFNRGISAGEAQAIYAAGASGKCRPCTTAPQSMVSWWPGEGNANDLQGLNDGTLGSGVTFAPGMVGQAFNFDESGVNLGDPANLKFSSAMTIDAWIYPTAAPNGPGSRLSIFAKWNEGLSDPTGDSYGLWLYNNGLEVLLNGNVHLTDNTESGLIGGTIPLNAWSHVAMTYDAGTKELNIYLNGQQIGPVIRSGQPILATDTTVYIGAEDFPGFNFAGKIDEVEVFNRALSPAEIRSIYNAGTGGKCPCKIPLKPGGSLFTPNSGINDGYAGGRGAVFLANEAVTVYGGGLWADPQGDFTLTVNLWETTAYPSNNVNNTLLASATVDLHDRGLAFYDVGFNVPVILVAGHKYHLEFVTGVAWDNTYYYGFNQGDVSLGPVDILDGTAGGDTVNSELPLIRILTCQATPAELELLNISGRANVGIDDNVAIAGFIIDSDSSNQTRFGTAGFALNKRVLVRGLGPSLAAYNLPTALVDPVLELHDSTGTMIASNDDWRIPAQNESDVLSSGLPPPRDVESALVRTLDANTSYTAILRGKSNGTGIGLVEVYDLAPTSFTHLRNISTRALVGTGDNVLICGIICSGDDPRQVLFRAIGPTLAQYNVNGPLQDPQLDVYDGHGNLIAHNDNWMQEPDGVNNPSRTSQINATGLPPPSSSEAAILLSPTPGNYTAIVSGVGGTGGVALAEAYRLIPSQ